MHAATGCNIFKEARIRCSIMGILRRNFLFWLEALSSLKKISEGINALVSLENLVKVINTPNTKNYSNELVQRSKVHLYMRLFMM